MKERFKYLGGIRTPHELSTDVTPLPNAYPPDGIFKDGMNNGGRPFALDLERNEFVVGTRYGRVARLSIIDPVLHGSSPDSLPVAPYATRAMVSLNGDLTQINADGSLTGVGLGGLLPLGNEIVASMTVYYDANNNQRKSHQVSNWPSTSPARNYQPNSTPYKSVYSPLQQGLVAGYMTPIPVEWQRELGGDVLTGNASLPIISHGSAGPCAIAFWADELNSADGIPGEMIVGYPNGHWIPGHPWNNPEPDEVYNQATMITGMCIIDDDLFFVGSHGYGKPCYGIGTGNADLADEPNYCYDPSDSAKGNHAYPYRIQVWHYSLKDLINAAAPWELVPEWFELTVPFITSSMKVNGCAYDPVTNRFYLCVYGADGYGYEPGPVIYVYEYDSSVEEPVDPDSEYIAQLEKENEELRKELKEATDKLDAIEIHALAILDLTKEE